jgi:flagellar basal-body rod protein FlgB
MFIRELATSDAMPALEATIRFTGRRQAYLANNIANADTPNFRPTDVPPAEFQRVLGEAIDKRRQEFGGHRGSLEFRSSENLRPSRSRLGEPSFDLRPSAQGRNILFHDRNDRDVERMMQDLIENTNVHGMAVQLHRGRSELLNIAIRERF